MKKQLEDAVYFYLKDNGRFLMRHFKIYSFEKKISDGVFD